MKTKIKVEKEVELKTLHVCAKVRYWEDGQINNGQIANWEFNIEDFQPEED